IILAMYIVTAKKQGVKVEKLSGTLQNDMLKEFIARGTYRLDLDSHMRITTDIIEFCIKKMPKFNPISVSGYHMREAGCSAIQEVAFTIANGLAYLQESIKRNLDPESVAERFSFFFGCHNNFFEEIAKFRCARELWAELLKKRFGIRNERALKLRFHTQTCGSTLTAQQPLNNVVRVAIQALAAVLGGTQSLHTNSYDEAIALPTDEAIKLALRTQQIIAYETDVTNTVDPLGGSFYIERLTENIKKEALKIIKTIEKMGGAVKAVKDGWIQKQIEEESYKYQKDIENKNKIIVGLNEFIEEYKEPQVFEVSYELEDSRRKEISDYKKNRNKDRSKLAKLKEAYRSGENIVEYVVDCVENGNTVGEIMGALE
ncbi:MAG: acyl-CoA mutase large subunit family protein, partial [bacterium]|nr:acyl-CoA mutase large subunit family protein [bacterium]